MSGLNAGLELGQAETLSFIGVVIAPYLVRKSSELFGLDVWIELDVQRALPVPITPSFAWRTILLACGSAEQDSELILALSGERNRRTVRGSTGRRGRWADLRRGGSLGGSSCSGRGGGGGVA